MRIFTTKSGTVEVRPSNKFVPDEDYFKYLDSLSFSDEEIGYDDEQETGELDLGFSEAEILPPLSQDLALRKAS